MSRSYSYKPLLRKRPFKARGDRKVILADYEIEMIEMQIGSDTQLTV